MQPVPATCARPCARPGGVLDEDASKGIAAPGWGWAARPPTVLADRPRRPSSTERLRSAAHRRQHNYCCTVPPAGSRPTWEYRFTRALCHGALQLPLAVVTVGELIRGWRPTSDDANIALRASMVFSSHSPLVGQFTQATQLDHHTTYDLGPLLYWVLAIPVRIDAQQGALWGSALLLSLALALIVEAAWAVGRRPAAVAATSLVAVVLIAEPRMVADPVWNPYVATIWTMVAAACTWAVINGRARWLPVLVFAASLASQAHLAAVIPCAALVVLAFAMGMGPSAVAAIRQRAEGGWRSFVPWRIASDGPDGRSEPASAGGWSLWVRGLLSEAARLPAATVAAARTGIAEVAGIVSSFLAGVWALGSDEGPASGRDGPASDTHAGDERSAMPTPQAWVCPVAAAGVVALACWIAPLIQEATTNPGNITLLLRGVGGGPSFGLVHGIEAMGSTIVPWPVWFDGHQATTFFGALAAIDRPGLTMSLVALLPVAAIVALRRFFGPVHASAALVVMVALLADAATVAAIPMSGLLNVVYLFPVEWPAGIAAVVLTAIGVARLAILVAPRAGEWIDAAMRRRDARTMWAPVRQRWARAAGAVGLVVSGVVAISSAGPLVTRAWPAPPTLGGWQAVSSVSSISGYLERVLPTKPVLIRAQGNGTIADYEVIFGVAWQLHVDGRPVHLVPQQAAYASATLASPPVTPATVVYITYTGSRARVLVTEGGRTMASRTFQA